MRFSTKRRRFFRHPVFGSAYVGLGYLHANDSYVPIPSNFHSAQTGLPGWPSMSRWLSGRGSAYRADLSSSPLNKIDLFLPIIWSKAR